MTTRKHRTRRCGCGKLATHRLKGGLDTRFKLWTPTGPRQGVPISRPVNLPDLCQGHALGVQRWAGGRVYRWRKTPRAIQAGNIAGGVRL